MRKLLSPWEGIKQTESHFLRQIPAKMSCVLFMTYGASSPPNLRAGKIDVNVRRIRWLRIGERLWILLGLSVELGEKSCELKKKSSKTEKTKYRIRPWANQYRGSMWSLVHCKGNLIWGTYFDPFGDQPLKVSDSGGSWNWLFESGELQAWYKGFIGFPFPAIFEAQAKINEILNEIFRGANSDQKGEASLLPCCQVV